MARTKSAFGKIEFGVFRIGSAVVKMRYRVLRMRLKRDQVLSNGPDFIELMLN